METETRVRRRRARTRPIGPLQTVLGEVVGYDGLVYEQLECTHLLLLVPTDYCRGFEQRRHCWLCAAASETPQRKAESEVPWMCASANLSAQTGS